MRRVSADAGVKVTVTPSLDRATLPAPTLPAWSTRVKLPLTTVAGFGGSLNTSVTAELSATPCAPCAGLDDTRPGLVASTWMAHAWFAVIGFPARSLAEGLTVAV